MADEPVNWDECLHYAAVTDIGMRRTNNEDSHAVALAGDLAHWRQRGHVFMVADGMGFHAAGELASKMAVDSVPHLYRKYRDLSPPEALKRAVAETNTEVNRRGLANPDFHQMGTTCSTLALLPQGALVAHIGDSRIYRLRGDCLEQLTFDHSLVWEMRAAGQLPDGSALSSMVPKNVITRSLGPHPNVQIDIEGPYPVQVGDTFLLCSDGLTGPVHDDELGPILASLEPDEAARALIDIANLRGGPDNITVIVAKVTGPQLATDQAGGSMNVGGQPKRRKVHPALWAITGACFLAAAVIYFLGAAYPALGALAVGLGFSCWVMFSMFSGGEEGIELSAARQLGKGPYVRVQSPASAAIVEKLAEMVRQLREGAEEEKWDVDLSRFEDFARRAADAARARAFPQALREYARALSFMQELRARNKKATDTSSVDLT
jgi:protein phosphatase